MSIVYDFNEDFNNSQGDDNPQSLENMRMAVQELTGVPVRRVIRGSKKQDKAGIDFVAETLALGWLGIDRKHRDIRKGCENLNKQWPDGDPRLPIEIWSVVTPEHRTLGWPFDPTKETDIYHFTFHPDITDESFTFWRVNFTAAAIKNIRTWIGEYGIRTQRTKYRESGRFHESACVFVPSREVIYATQVPEMPGDEHHKFNEYLLHKFLRDCEREEQPPF